MIKLELTLDNIDYDDLIDRYLPLVRDHLQASSNPVALLLSNGMSSAMAKKIVHTLPQQKKDELATELINANKKKLLSKATTLAEEQNISVNVVDLGASVK